MAWDMKSGHLRPRGRVHHHIASLGAAVAPAWSGPGQPCRRAGAPRPLAGALAAKGGERHRRGLFAPTGCRWSCPAPARGKAPGKRSSSPWPARAGNSTPRMQFVSTRPQPQQLGIQGLGLDSGSWSWAQALPPEEVCHQEPALRAEMAEGMPPMQVGAAPAGAMAAPLPWGRGGAGPRGASRLPRSRAAAGAGPAQAPSVRAFRAATVQLPGPVLPGSVLPGPRAHGLQEAGPCCPGPGAAVAASLSGDRGSSWRLIRLGLRQAFSWPTEGTVQPCLHCSQLNKRV